MFSCEFCEIFKKTYFVENLRTSAFYIHNGIFTVNLKDLISFCASRNHTRITSQTFFCQDFLLQVRDHSKITEHKTFEH